MKILYDNQIFSQQNFGGISRYFYELIKRLRSEIDCELPIVFSNNYYIRQSDVITCRTFFPNWKFQGRTTLIKYFNTKVQKSAFRKDYDIFHPTYYNPYFIKNIGNKPFILTVHDLIYQKLFATPPKNDWALEGMKILIVHAAQIIAVSENTKKDIIDVLHVSPEKVHVIYHGCSLNPFCEKKMQLPERYLLYVGERNGYKNFKNLAVAFSRLMQSDKGLKLIVAGKLLSNDDLSLLHALKITGSVLHYMVSDEILSNLYASALAFVYPSIYEGFGIPILEAYTCGCPVVLSQNSCFPEIAGKAGEYFDPLDVDSIITAIQNVIYSDTRRNELIFLGKNRSKLFSWEKAAKKTLQVYQALV